MKRKVLSLVLALAFILSFASGASAQRAVKVYVGGTDIEPDVAPVIVEGRVMLPVRAVFEAIKAKVSYNAAERKVTAVKKDTTVEFIIDSKVMTINGEAKEIDVPATIINGRTLVPLRACAEAFKLDVAWNPDRYIAKVKYPVALELEKKNQSYTSTYTYDENGYESSWVSSDEKVTYQYDADGNMLYFERVSPNYTMWGKYEYDVYGNLILQEDSGGTYQKYTYDDHQHRLIRKEDKDGSNYVTYTYTADGKIASEVYSWGSSLIYSYDENGNASVQGDNGYWEKYTYNANGDLLSKITSDEETFEINEYDASGRLIKETVAAFGMEDTNEYAYDENGRIAYVKNPGGETKYTYNEFGDIMTEESDGILKTYTYDANGNLLREECQGGSWTNYTYDENGNLISSETSYGETTKYITVVR